MPNTKQESGFVHLVAVIVIGSGILLLFSSLVPITRQFNEGNPSVAGIYLAKGGSDDGGSSGSGDNSSGSSSNNSGSSNSGSGNSNSNSSGGTSGNSNSGSSNNSTSAPSTPTPTNKVETKEVIKLESRKKEKIETSITPQKVKSEIRQGDLRVKFEIENGKVKIETKVKQPEDEVELEDEAEDEAVKEVEAELEKDNLKIATAPGQIALVNKKVGALTNFPISVNPTTKELTVTTPEGSKVVTVLPQQAIDNLLTSRVMTEVESEKVDNSLASIEDLVSLETKEGVLVYKVKGIKTHRLLGFIPIKTQVEAFVSAENGAVTESTDSLLGRILNRIAP